MKDTHAEILFVVIWLFVTYTIIINWIEDESYITQHKHIVKIYR
jgi:hypothetical protein